MTLLSIIAFGFFLGMRHAADPDHVVAVTTIVLNEQFVDQCTCASPELGAVVRHIVVS